LKEVHDFGTKIGFSDSETEGIANSKSIIEKILRKLLNQSVLIV
jgi:hypothetical protein